MSSLKRAIKSRQRLHKERHQPDFRKHLGYLEKKKDYKQRANDFQKKEKAYKLMRQKVLDKNSEEFHFHMIRSQLKDGVHYEMRDDDKELTAEEKQLMQTQDINYIQQKRIIELKKIEKLRQNLHLIDCEKPSKNKHYFFVDNKKEKKNFDFAKRLNTSEELLKMGYNISNSDQLMDKIDEKDIKNIAHLRNKSYQQLERRIERLKFLDLLYQKMDIKKKLLNKKEEKPKSVSKGSTTKAPQFKWKSERKR
ncbi:probable U3 small nucleolar RNA-associated protein 11 [Oppia nitens]|uniref:probable U3 small nucleolar RNA-associated protein 11 n=1 Tax=Oppia nitens TaxID=1686743 RepID=UPI0023DB8914|nr:probable U3 small nucleolar RNA-associated protein 11 [Oppia nitens]